MSADASQNSAEKQTSDRISSVKGLSRRAFTERVLIIVGIVTAAGLLLSLLWYGSEVILLVFAGLLLAIFLRSLSGFLRQYTPLSETWALSVVILAILGLIVLGVWLIAPSVQQQFNELARELPAAIRGARERVSQIPFGAQILDQLPQLQQAPGKQSSNIFGRVTGFFSSALGVLVNILIVLIVALYFAFNPRMYESGIVKLVPQSRAKRTREVLETLGITLRNFLLGISCSMIINGTLTFLGLWFFGIPFAIPLAIIAALLSFVPNIGPIAASVPAILIALAQSPAQAIYVLLIYLAVQNLDGFLITPLIQQRAISIPPVLVIGSQLMLGILFGFLGVLLAVPIIAVVFVLVKMLYVEDVLGNKVTVKGEKQAKQQVQNETA